MTTLLPSSHDHPDVAVERDPDRQARLRAMLAREPIEYRPADGRAPGRPTLLGPETRLRLIETIEMGTPYHAAARWAGIARSTFHVWRKRGEAAAELRDAGKRVKKSEVPFLQLWDDLEMAEARAHRRVVAHWNTHFSEDARACQTFLERRFRDDWGPDPIEVTGPGGGPLIDPEAIVAAGLARLAEIGARLAALPAADDAIDVPIE